MTLGWGVAATGRIARDVGGVIAGHPRMRVAAVGSRDLARARALAADLGGTGYGSYAELIADPEVEAVYVATPHARHAEVIGLALDAGKAVLCEKPMTHRLAETERLAALADERGVFLMEGMWMRFNPLVQLLAARVAGGQLGEIRSVQASLGFMAPDDPQHRLWNPDLGGGALLDLGVYAIDLARLLLGEPERIEAVGSLHATGVDAESSVRLSFPGGSHALLGMSLVSRVPTRAVVVGSRGYAELGPTFYAPTSLHLDVDGADPEDHLIEDRQAGFVGELEEVARCLQAGLGQSPVLPLAETVATMRVLDVCARQLRV